MIPISELDLIKIGEIFKAHGYKGELVIKLSIDFDRLIKTDPVFLQIDGNMVPFFFSEELKLHKKTGIIAKFENIDADKEVNALLSYSVFMPKDNILKEIEDTSLNYENYSVFNKDNYLGKAAGFLDIPSNPILTVKTKSEKEILIPINDQFIVEIDDENQKIIFNLPEGLVDINI